MSIDLDPSLARMRSVIERFATDYRLLGRGVRLPMSTKAREQIRSLLVEWQTRLGRVDFNALDQDDRIDYLLLRKELAHEMDELEFAAQRDAELHGLLPFASNMLALLEAQQAMQPVAGARPPSSLSEITKQIDAAGRVLPEPPTPSRSRWPIVACSVSAHFAAACSLGSTPTLATTPTSPGGPQLPIARWTRR